MRDNIDIKVPLWGAAGLGLAGLVAGALGAWGAQRLRVRSAGHRVRIDYLHGRLKAARSLIEELEEQLQRQAAALEAAANAIASARIHPPPFDSLRRESNDTTTERAEHGTSN